MTIGSASEGWASNGSHALVEQFEVRFTDWKPATGNPPKAERMRYPITPDGRYFVVRGRLWRMSDPSLPEDRRQQLVNELMDARRAVRDANRADDAAALKTARAAVDKAKVALGERGPIWWEPRDEDDAKDWNRFLAKNSPYADWFASLDDTSG